ncbi:MAG: UDP-N-acetylmuramoyl-tripeptide--D-alanyl-D-alanine ligase [Burkholderiales bacterium]|nr:UDP-N-acetylmuramoyl-tripeptide--D-alanyl-D-alanine ligase [Burkholderiales bacterium]
MTLTAAARAMQADPTGAEVTITGVSTDTRKLAPGDLFFALRGERHDAVQFVDQALGAGAAAAVVPRDATLEQPLSGPVVRVDDTRLALGRLAVAWRARFDLPLIALTGSNGKTTVKEMIGCVLREAAGDPAGVLATQGNLNNDIGVPLTLLRLREGHRYAVIEMGMNHAGEIRYLAGLARPDVALVTNAGRAHIGILGSMEAIAQAKGEIYEGLAASGAAVINADDGFAPLWRSLNAGRRVVTFGIDAPADLRARHRDRGLTSEIELSAPTGEVAITLPAAGLHNVRNALAAAAAAFALGIPLGTIAAGLARFPGVPGRLQRRPGRNGATLIDDTYNANPDSVLAAIAVLRGLPGRRILVLGDMGELGGDAAAMHALVGAAARSAGIDRLVTLGELSAEAARAYGPGASHHARIEDLLADVAPELDGQATLLVKGSRFMQMERVVRSFELPTAAAPGRS